MNNLKFLKNLFHRVIVITDTHLNKDSTEITVLFEETLAEEQQKPHNWRGSSINPHGYHNDNVLILESSVN